MDAFCKHSNEEWSTWAHCLPSSGCGGWTQGQWLVWIECMIVKKIHIQRLQQTMEAEWRKAPFWPGEPPAGEPSEGSQAAASSCKPATGEPSQGTGSAPSNSKAGKRKFRDTMRSATPPPLCNRVNSDWGMAPAPCHCREWPSWLSVHAWTPLVKDVTAEIADSHRSIMKVAIGRNVQYWRPCASGRRGEKGWYLGKVHTLKQVTFPSGQSRVVVGLN